MKRVLILCVVLAAVLGAVYGVITVYDNTMSAGRMWQTPAIKPHEHPIAAMAAGVVPFNGGEALWRAADPKTLASPLKLADPTVITGGQKAYQTYCIHCHGKYHDGNGTVGQSFAPLPGDLRSPRVQTLAVGALFQEISYGIAGGRQPALATTVSANDRWRAIAYIKSLGTRP